MEENKVRRAYLITSLNSYAIVKKLRQDGDLIIVIPNENYHQIEDLGPSFYPEIQMRSDHAERVTSFVTSWYKNALEDDLTLTPEGFSLGALLSCSLGVEFPMILKESWGLNKWKDQVSEFVFPANYSLKKYVDILMQNCGYKISYYNFWLPDTPISDSYNFRSYDKRKHVHFGKKVASIIFFPVKKNLVLGKNLYLDDWTYKFIIDKDDKGVMINGTSLRQNVFHFSIFSQKKLPSLIQVNTAQIIKNIQEQLALRNYAVELAAPVWVLVRQAYEGHKLLFESIYSFYDDILKLKPRSLTLPTDFYEEFNIAVQLASLRGVQTYQLIDGFPITASAPFFSNHGRPYFSNIYAQSPVFKDQFIRYKNIPAEHIEVISPYAAEKVSQIKKERESTFDALVFTLIPNNGNPEFSISHLRNYLLDVCSLLKEKGYKKIVIKCKNRIEKHYVESVAKVLGLEFTFEPSLSIMPKARMIVGGISSAAMEAHLLDIPYYIYEPIENAYSEKQLEESSFKLKKYTARSVAGLSDNISQNLFFGVEGFLV